jgi:hypothetical protein
MIQVRFRIATLMTLVAACGLALGLYSRLSRETVSVLIEQVFPLLLISVLPLAVPCLIVVLFLRGRLGQPVVTCALAGIALAGASALLIGLFLTEPLRVRLERIAFSEGLLLGLVFGVQFRVRARRYKFLPRPRPDARRKALRLNLSLAILIVTLIAISWAIPKLKWSGQGSVGLAVAVDNEGWLSVDFYGRAVNRRTIETVLDRIPAGGSVERIDLLGHQFGRGFLSYDPRPGGGAEAVWSISFHSTEVGDWAIPHLKRFCRLGKLDLRETRISETGMTELRSALPGCNVIH